MKKLKLESASDIQFSIKSHTFNRAVIEDFRVARVVRPDKNKLYTAVSIPEQ